MPRFYSDGESEPDPNKELPFTAHHSHSALYAIFVFLYFYFFFLVICISKLGKLDKDNCEKGIEKFFAFLCAVN